MPTLSMFYGIVITMFSEQGAPHHRAHFHARYGQYNASFDLSGNLISGSFPAKQRKLIAAWAEIHHDELMANWDLLSCGEKPYRIDPLR